VGDVFGSGHRDLVLAMHLRGLVVLRNDGRGNFSSASRGLDFLSGRPGETLGFSSHAIRLVHWTSPARLDILALAEGPLFSPGARGREGPSGFPTGTVIYLNQGDGSWRRRDGAPGARGIFGDALALGDFFGDGRLGFATASNVSGLKDLVNVRTADGGWQSVSVDPIRPMAYVTAVAAADFARRGRSDLALGYLSFELATWRAGIDVLTAQPDGRWTRRVISAERGQRRVTSLAAGDVDGDGHRDLVAVTGRGEVWIFLGDGGGSFTREKTSLQPFGACQGARVELADLDGDGRDEIVASFGDEAAECPSGGGVAAWKIFNKK
jgi:hypothetical protein